jgi:hypothetical protein
MVSNMIRLMIHWLKSLFNKPKPKDYIHLVKQFENGKYLCVINGNVYSLTDNQYKEYLKKFANDNPDKHA